MLLLGDCIAYSAVLDGRHVVYTPSYGPETRGGKARCYVVISDGEIDTPIPEEPDLMIILNQPSMDFVPMLGKGGAPALQQLTSARGAAAGRHQEDPRSSD